jgi:hypothetical protein
MRPGPVSAVPALGATAIDLALWTENAAPRKGDLIELLVSASLACHLTLIGVDRDGRALVLFPNDLEPANLIAPGTTIRVPGSASGYQLRLDRAGQESFIAICQRGARSLDGIAFDYEKQRFTILGDWHLFLGSVAEKPPARNKERTPGASVGEDAPGLLGRAAITISVGE